jgi:hypothetical protein
LTTTERAEAIKKMMQIEMPPEQIKAVAEQMGFSDEALGHLRAEVQQALQPAKPRNKER